jgi:hypothetical protein
MIIAKAGIVPLITFSSLTRYLSYSTAWEFETVPLSIRIKGIFRGEG